MRIGELSDRTGVSERALRYYEEQGLLVPQRRPNGYRVYDQGHVIAVTHIRTLLAAGLRTAIIAEVLPCMVDDGDRLRAAACPELIDVLREERQRIDSQIGELESARTALDDIIATPALCHAGADRSLAATTTW